MTILLQKRTKNEIKPKEDKIIQNVKYISYNDYLYTEIFIVYNDEKAETIRLEKETIEEYYQISIVE